MSDGTIVTTKYGELRRNLASVDGKLHTSGKIYEWELKCPGCGTWGLLDEDQLHGRVSVDHAAQGCPGGYHETHDFAAEIADQV